MLRSSRKPKKSRKKSKAKAKRKKSKKGKKKKNVFKSNPDLYKTMEEVTLALKEAGLESSNLIVGIDCTASNEEQGARTFEGKNLHDVSGYSQGKWNPYQQVIFYATKALGPFDDDELIPAFGFGDATTKNHAVFPFHTEPQGCFGFEGVMTCYNEIIQQITLKGPTSFAPIIDKAIEIVEQTKEYHILLIIADGMVVSKKATEEAIVKASNYPLSIIIVGVGDGPWEEMENYDDKLPKRKFDNLQFVNFNNILEKHVARRPIEFAVAALQEIPAQYKYIVEHDML